jgi:hypothetical protein
LKKNPANNESDPNNKHKIFYSKVNSTVLRDLPPNLTIESWIIIVKMRITTNRGLLKKFLKTFI